MSDWSLLFLIAVIGLSITKYLLITYRKLTDKDRDDGKKVDTSNDAIKLAQIAKGNADLLPVFKEDTKETTKVTDKPATAAIEKNDKENGEFIRC